MSQSRSKMTPEYLTQEQSAPCFTSLFPVSHTGCSFLIFHENGWVIFTTHAIFLHIPINVNSIRTHCTWTMAQYITLLPYIKVIQSWPDLLHFRYLVIQRTSWSKNRPMLYLIGQNSCLTNSNSTSTLTLVCVSFFSLTNRPAIHFSLLNRT